MFSAAGGTGFQHFIACAAIVTLETVFFAVIGERDVALFAFGDVSAVAAEHGLRISSAIEE